MNNIYTKYIYNKFSFDNDDERLNWLLNQADSGKLHFYNQILLKIQKENIKKILDLENKKIEVEEENNKIYEKLEEEKRKNEFLIQTKSV